MRPIKFRAFSKLYGMYQGEDFPDNIFRNGEMHSEMKEDVVAVMQFTGLKDRNGKEIYEGDVVRFDTKVEGVKAEWSDPVVVLWNQENARFDWDDSFQGFIYKAYEVLGNIYENPELLTKQ